MAKTIKPIDASEGQKVQTTNQPGAWTVSPSNLLRSKFQGEKLVQIINALAAEPGSAFDPIPAVVDISPGTEATQAITRVNELKALSDINKEFAVAWHQAVWHRSLTDRWDPKLIVAAILAAPKVAKADRDAIIIDTLIAFGVLDRDCRWDDIIKWLNNDNNKDKLVAKIRNKYKTASNAVRMAQKLFNILIKH